VGDFASWVGVVVSAGSLVVATIALRRSGGAAAEANAVQRRLVAIEEGRESERRTQSQTAVLRPALRKTGKSTYRLCVTNAGASAAKDLQVRLDGKPLAEHDAAVANNALPSLVGPHSEVACLLGLHLQCAPPFQIHMTWHDDSGEQGRYEGTLTF
jgi:hypothetical protein